MRGGCQYVWQVAIGSMEEGTTFGHCAGGAILLHGGIVRAFAVPRCFYCFAFILCYELIVMFLLFRGDVPVNVRGRCKMGISLGCWRTQGDITALSGLK